MHVLENLRSRTALLVIVSSALGITSMYSMDCVDRVCSSADSLAITESPQGLIDGHNATFRLRKIPSKEAPVQLFRNGVALRSDVDYEVAGQILTTSSSKIPSPGDVLHVVYTPSSNSRSQPFGPSPGIVDAAATARATEITMAATRDALQMEEGRASAEARRTRTRSSGNFYSAQGREDVSSSVPASLRLLMSGKQLQTTRRTNNPTDSRTISVQGVDGLADSPVEQPFGFETHTSIDAYQEGLSSTPTLDSATEPGVGGTSSALSMLDGRLRSLDRHPTPEDNKDAIDQVPTRPQAKRPRHKWQLWQ